jgi:hypothetical protein
VLSDHADCEYACSNPYDPVAERTLLWNDPTLSIRWPLDAQATPILSPRDRAGILFTEAEKFGRQSQRFDQTAEDLAFLEIPHPVGETSLPCEKTSS